MDTTEQARKIGAEHGRNAAGWVFNGNTDAGTYRSVLAGMEAGDPLTMGALGEGIPSLDAAGDYTLADLAEEIGIDGGPELGAAEIAYLDAASEAFGMEVERTARAHVQPHGLDIDAVYSVAGSPGVAWHVVTGDAVDGKVGAVMVGDDREHAVDVADLTAIDPDAVCTGCGQIGCEGDFRHA